MIKRIQLYWLAYRVARIWRKHGGGSCRYKFTVHGGYMAFSAPEHTKMEDLARLLHAVADTMEAPTTPCHSL